MGSGTHGVAGPYFFTVLIERDPFAVADAVRAGENSAMAVRTVQLGTAHAAWPSSGRSVGARSIFEAFSSAPQCGVTQRELLRDGKTEALSILQLSFVTTE